MLPVLLGRMAQNGIAGSYGTIIYFFFFVLRNHHTVDMTFYTPQEIHKILNFSTSFSTFLIVLHFDRYTIQEVPSDTSLLF